MGYSPVKPVSLHVTTHLNGGFERMAFLEPLPLPVPVEEGSAVPKMSRREAPEDLWPSDGIEEITQHPAHGHLGVGETQRTHLVKKTYRLRGSTSFVYVLSSHLFGTSGLWTYQPGSHRRKVTQEEVHTGFLHLPSVVLAFIFFARRIRPFLSLVDREVEFVYYY